jgi:hypothetical protein|nr:hypothetical protein [uncultured Lachnoanaerobaculum sp.]DAF32884.1 MAG TPA: hypothetical protein [Caudoviricetes sp.]DAR21694.1 MAG TPA: hypothetical protein [Caudoviricetes sp.]DAY25773.1 MAG TPA: hypothetical protein [Caudoviricetes sp.]
MRYTVFYKPDGTVISIAAEQFDIKNIKIDTFEIPDNHIIDSIDVSKKEHAAVSHATPMGDFAKLREEIEATNRHLDELNHKRSEETAEMRAAILASATMIAAIAPPNGINEEEN